MTNFVGPAAHTTTTSRAPATKCSYQSKPSAQQFFSCVVSQPTQVDSSIPSHLYRIIHLNTSHKKFTIKSFPLTDIAIIITQVILISIPILHIHFNNGENTIKDKRIKILNLIVDHQISATLPSSILSIHHGHTSQSISTGGGDTPSPVVHTNID